VALVEPTIEVFFDGVNATDISQYGYSVSIRRGRTRELDDVATGVATVGLRNHTGRFVPYDVAVEGTEILEEDGDTLLDELGNSLLEESGSAFAANIAPGKRVRITVGAVVVFDGKLDDWNYNYQPNGLADASFEAVDAFGDIARKTLDEHTSTSSQRAGARLTTILARSEVNYAGTTSFDTGVESLQGNTVTDGTNALDAMKLVARTDSGVLYVSRTGVLTFKDRDSLAVPVAAESFADDGSAIRFHAIAPGFGRELLFNYIRVSRAGGETVTATDSTSTGEYGIRSLDRLGMLFEYEWQSSNMAEYLLASYKQPRTRIESLTVVLNRLSAPDQAAVLALDLTDAIDVSWIPEGLSSTVEQTLVIEGVDHQVTFGGAYVVTFQLSQPLQTTAFILDDATYGVLDQSLLSF
jgi:hypothetical protein